MSSSDYNTDEMYINISDDDDESDEDGKSEEDGEGYSSYVSNEEESNKSDEYEGRDGSVEGDGSDDDDESNESYEDSDSEDDDDSDESGEYESEDENMLTELENLGEEIDWGIEKERNKLLRLMCYRKFRVSNIRLIFRPEQIEYLLMDCINYWGAGKCNNKRALFIEFVARTGYRNQPELNNDGKPILHLTTAVHLAARHGHWDLISVLFEIYDRFDVNYTDEFGLTHFHVACMSGRCKVVEKFLELGQEPNGLAGKHRKSFGHPPLHLALARNQRQVFELLLRIGACPNLTDEDGFTALHIICKRIYDCDFVDLFFKINDDRHQSVWVDAKDKFGLTPLQWAVKNFLPHVVDVLLDRGADLSSVDLRTWRNSADRFESTNEVSFNLKLRLASGALAILESLEKRGYKLDRSEATMIMTLFSTEGLFEKSMDFDERWFDDEKFTTEAKKIMIDSRLSFYDLIRLPPEEATKRVTYQELFKFASMDEFWKLTEIQSEACVAYLCEILTRDFRRRWLHRTSSDRTMRKMITAAAMSMAPYSAKQKQKTMLCRKKFNFFTSKKSRRDYI
ncbi:unnamed protein product [Trichogramma brassicae]|uniref:Uncharacterized protein n=1 Tax=Trichogramma brassicae TaxID=86971 RepID=A0A6H5IX64_9HYME|nr:unnamed protein product [Trichogramma brassicae]